MHQAADRSAARATQEIAMRMSRRHLWPQRRSPRTRLRTALAALLLAIGLSGGIAPAAASAREPAGLCLSAAERAARATGVPLAVLQAIALAETGRRQGEALRPWPWAVNAGGAGRWLATRAEAAAFLRARLAAGERNLDVGCFQINVRWHGRAFPSAEAMLDPQANALYAARFLHRLHAEAGDWQIAAGLYHSRTPAFAERYRARFRQLLARADASPDATGRPRLHARLAEPGQGLRDAGARPLPLVAGAVLLAGSVPGGAGDDPRSPRGSLFARADAAARPIVDLAAGRPE